MQLCERETPTRFSLYYFRGNKRLVPSRLQELHVLKFPFVPSIEFMVQNFQNKTKLSNFSAHVSGAHVISLLFHVFPPLPPSRRRQSVGSGGPAESQVT